ncbi:hypothetical protein P3S68_004045 [Capsicum galapagoense]
MSKIKKTKLVIIPSPGMGRLLPTTEMAKRLIMRDEYLSVTILVLDMNLDSNLNPYIQSLYLNSNCTSSKFLPRDKSAL